MSFFDFQDEKFMSPNDRFECVDEIVRVTSNIKILEQKWRENELDHNEDLTPYCGTVAKVIGYSSYDDCIELRWANGDIGWIPCSACIVIDGKENLSLLNNVKWPNEDFVLSFEQEKKIAEYFPHFKEKDKNYQDAKVLYYKTICLLEQDNVKNQIIKYLDIDTNTPFCELFHHTPVPTYKKEFPLYGKTSKSRHKYLIELKQLYVKCEHKEDFYPLTFIGSISFYYELIHWLGFMYLKEKGKEKLKSPKELGHEAGYHFELQCTTGLWGLSFVESGDGMVEYVTYFAIDNRCPDLRPQVRQSYETALILQKEFTRKYVFEYNGESKFWDQVSTYTRKATRSELGRVERAKISTQKNPFATPKCGKQ